MSNLFPDDNSNPPEKPQQPLPPQGQANPYSTPADYQHPPAHPHPGQQGDSTGGVIPYKNPHALIAYYLGIVALFPLIGVPFGIASIILGVSGLKKRKQNPVIKGSVHAWIGILGGVFSLICGGVLSAAMVMAAMR